MADLLAAQADVFAQLDSLDSGKLASFARLVDVPIAISAFRYSAGW